MKAGWTMRPLDELISSKGGNNKLIKGTLSSEPGDRLFPAYSASGPDVWTSTAEYSGSGIVISAVGARCGKTFLATGKWTAIANTHVLIPGEQVDVKWLWYLTNDEQFWVKGGSAQPFVKVKDTLKIPRLIPQLAEQKRIAALLDEAFAGIDEAKVKAEANLDKAKAIFESHLQSLFGDNTAGWVDGKLSSLTTKIGSGATPRGGEESYKSEGVSLIRSLNVHDLGFKYAKLAFLDETQADELSGVTVQEDDVLLNITGASVARCTIAPRDVLPARVNQHVAIIRPIPGKMLSAFLHYLLISKPYKSRLLETGEEGGSTRQAITKAQLQDFTISHPVSTKAQQAIATHIDEILGKTQRLSELHSQRIEAFSALRSSILAQAFAGELTA